MTTTDAGGMPLPPVETRFLEIESGQSYALVFGESVDLSVRYLDMGRAPLASETVRFSFDGRAHDSSLLSVESTTDELGVARVRLVAGTTDAAFRVRATAADASPVYFLIAVSDNGFGQLEVQVRYEGGRDLRMRGVGVFPGLSCAEVEPPERGDRYQWVGPDEQAVTFLALPAGVASAVTARGEGPTSEVLAYACLDGVVIDADTARHETLELADLPLIVDGSFAGTISFDATLAGEELVGSALAATGRFLETEGGAGELILDAAEDALRQDGNDEAAMSLARARMTENLDEALATSLRTSMVGPQVALLRLDQLLRPQIQDVKVEGVLRLVGSEATYEVQRLLVGQSGSPSVLELPTGTRVEARIENETWLLERLELSFSASNLVRALLIRSLEEGETRAELVARLAHCDALPALTTTSCDASCLMAGCHAAAEQLLGALEAALEESDASRSWVVAVGDVPLEDRNANLEVDGLTATLRAAWAGEVGESAVLSVELDAQRITPPR